MFEWGSPDQAPFPGSSSSSSSISIIIIQVVINIVIIQVVVVVAGTFLLESRAGWATDPMRKGFLGFHRLIIIIITIISVLLLLLLWISMDFLKLREFSLNQI